MSTFKPGRSIGVLDGTDPVVIMPAPTGAAGQLRTLARGFIKNDDSVSHTVTVAVHFVDDAKNVGGRYEVEITPDSLTLQAGDVLELENVSIEPGEELRAWLDAAPTDGDAGQPGFVVSWGDFT